MIPPSLLAERRPLQAGALSPAVHASSAGLSQESRWLACDASKEVVRMISPPLFESHIEYGASLPKAGFVSALPKCARNEVRNRSHALNIQKEVVG